MLLLGHTLTALLDYGTQGSPPHFLPEQINSREIDPDQNDFTTGNTTKTLHTVKNQTQTVRLIAHFTTLFHHHSHKFRAK
ncbi:hypothetical protein [Arcanobacterium hippocoleae]|uniref:Uncharacterized protein n=1 Tax=Arcanobacterium hippocoleae TaxID=149017 RepID=A0ABU1T1T9_9ACTO|nr:hypothetical protein [Arcanobacterium hippocoleae]MDR6939298.1 hypothetical protein [Arcanobacterium hippocoleae]